MTSDITMYGVKMLLAMFLVPVVGLIVEGLKVGYGKKQ